MSVPGPVAGAPKDLRDLRLRDHRPRSMLRAEEHRPRSARFPVVDAHAHLGRWLSGGWAASDVGALVAEMDERNVRAIVNLDGRPDELDDDLARYDRAHPGRFVTFAHVDWDEPSRGAGFGDRMAAQLRDAVRRGARGLKVWKVLGLHVRDDRGALLMPDDERLAPLWDAAASHSTPVTIHVADPVAFFEPFDAENERVEELLEHPEWWVGDTSRFPRFDALLDGFEVLVGRHPDTTFIGAHVANSAEDLGRVDEMLDAHPNLSADVGARLAELGRQPRATRALILAHPDRILFGTDAVPPTREAYTTAFRFFETADEHFDYADDPIPPQGRWRISGLDLPDDVLRAVYAENALRLIPGLAG